MEIEMIIPNDDDIVINAKMMKPPQREYLVNNLKNAWYDHWAGMIHVPNGHKESFTIAQKGKTDQSRRSINQEQEVQ